MKTKFSHRYFRFGSSDSNDADVMIEHNEATGEEYDHLLIKDLKKLHPEIRDWDINIIKIENGVVSSSIPSKGSFDSVNNSLYDTYSLHSQAYPFPLERRLPRNLLMAIVKCIRVIITAYKECIDKDYYRINLRPVLKTGDFDNWVKVLLEIDLGMLAFASEVQHVDVYKRLAFWLAQTIALFKDEEVYTKAHVKVLYPELSPLINRECVDGNLLLKEKIWLLNDLVKALDIQILNEDVVGFNGSRVNFRTEMSLPLT